MYHLFTILVKPKYNINYVKAIHNSFEKYVSLPFKHTCLTDDIKPFENENFCDVIDIGCYNLPTFWNKMLFFKPNAICKNNEKCIFFDLDSVILRDVKPILNYVDNKIIIGQNPSKINPSYVTGAINSTGHGRHLTIVNSSCMMWIGGQHDKLWDIFNLRPEEHMIRYYGNDEFITFEYPTGYCLIDKRFIFSKGSESTSIYKNKMSAFEMLNL